MRPLAPQLPRFSIVRLLIAALFGVATWEVARINGAAYLGRDGQAELAPVGKQYGPHHYSRDAEEWFIRDYFQDRRNGVFLDVGANHYRDESNTYYLETTLGWSGIAIDALEEFADGYTQYRPRTRFFALFVSDVGGSTAELFVPTANRLIASGSFDFTVQQGSPGTARRIPTTTLNAVLERTGVSRIDFLTMDIELSEPRALAGFDIDRYKPSLACVEAHPEVRQQILDYFAGHRYTIIGKYLRADPKNLYFRPLG